MTARQVAMTAIIGVMAMFAVAPMAGCDRQDSPSKQDGQEQAATTKEVAKEPVSTQSKPEGIGVPLGDIQVPEGTPEGEWLEIGGHTPFLWCYRGGKHLEFRQHRPRVYLSVDGGKHKLAGIIVRSKEEAGLLCEEAAKSPHPLTAWVYSAKLPWLKLVRTPDKVKSIQVWEFDYALLKDLTPLKAFGDLESLALRGCEAVSDLGPLAELTKLVSLNLTYCKSVNSGSSLIGLKALRWLSLGSTGMKEFGFISAFAQLRFLELGRKNVADFGFLAATKDLETLKVKGYGEGQDSLSRALSDLPKLKHLTLRIPSRVVLPESLSSLRTLTIEYAGQFDFGRIQHLTSLRSLTCKDLSRKLDLAPLAALANLERLSLEHFAADRHARWQLSLEPVGALKRLRELKLKFRYDTSFSLAPLSQLTSLTSLEIEAWHVPSLAPLGQLTSLRELHLHLIDEEFSDIDPITGLAELRSLSLRSLPVKSLPSLRKLTKLTTLSVSGDVEDISAITELPSLTDLEVIEISPKDLSPLERLPKLRRLVIDDCCSEEQLSKILATQTALHELEADSLDEPIWDSRDEPTQQRDFGDVLKNLKDLRYLKMRRLHDFSPLRGLEKLTYVEVLSTSARTLEPVADLTHLHYFEAVLSFVPVLLEVKGERVDFAAPLARLDALVKWRGIILHIENVERQVDRGTYLNSIAAEEMRKRLFSRDMQESR